MTHFGRTANLQVILNHNTDLQEKIAEALTALKDIDREDHRGMFAGTDLSAWSSTEFKATPACIDEATLARIVTCLCELYTVPRSYWENKISRQARLLGGVVIGRVIYSSRVRQNSVIFRNEGRILAGMITKVIDHPHPHPVTRDIIRTSYLEISVMEPINQEDDLYRQLNCGWLCLQVPPTTTLVTVLWSSIISHFVRTDLTLAIKGDLVTHVYPVPKGSMLRNIYDLPHLMLYDRYSARMIPECQHCPITRMFGIGVMNKTYCKTHF